MDGFRPQLPTLSADVLGMLTPALDIIAQEARHGARLVEGKRADRAAKVTARINGGGSNYNGGHEAIMAEVFGDALVREIRALASRSVPAATCHNCNRPLSDDGCSC